MKKLIMFVLYIHMLPLVAISWIALFDVLSISEKQFWISLLMAFISLVIISGIKMDEQQMDWLNAKE